jgi:hypothetical protein
LLDVEQWAEIRRMAKVERRSQREIHRLTGIHRDTIRRALAADEPPSYGPRPKRPSKLGPFVGEIERLLDQEPTLSGVRIREEIEELGYCGGKTILDDLLRELRPATCHGRAPTSAPSTDPASWPSSISLSPGARSRSAGISCARAISSPASCPTRAPLPAPWSSRRSFPTLPGA